MTTLPIAICLFTTTKPHFGHYTYLDTIKHLDRQIPLSSFSGLYAHIKVTPGQEDIAERIEANLVVRGFHVQKTSGEWARGTSHQQHYLSDMAKASQSPVIQSQAFMMLLEDDSTLSPVHDNLLYHLARMVKYLESDHNLVSTRLIRRNDFEGGVSMIDACLTHFYSTNYDFQPSILRSRDFLIANKVIQDNWSQLSHLQCELVMRIALDTLSRSERRHLVLHPDQIHTIHLGTPDYPALKSSLGLS